MHLNTQVLAISTPRNPQVRGRRQLSTSSIKTFQITFNWKAFLTEHKLAQDCRSMLGSAAQASNRLEYIIDNRVQY